MRVRGHLAAYALFLGLVAFYTWPLLSDPAHLIPSNPDPRLFSWVTLTIFRNLTTRPALLFHGNAFYPIGDSLALAEPLLVQAVVAGPLFVVTGNPVLAYNVTLILFWALSGWAMYAVSFWLLRSHLAAFVAAVMFTFAPYRMDHFREFQMEMAFGIPLAVYALVRFLEEQRARHLAGFLVTLWLQAASVWYYTIILSFGLAAVAVQYVALRWRGWRARAVLAAGGGGVLLVLALVPLAWPYFVMRWELGYHRGMSDAIRRSANILSYVELRANWLYRAFTVERNWEASLFLGAFGLILVVCGLLWLRRDRPETRSRAERWLATAAWACLALLALTVVAALGPVEIGLPFTEIGVALLGVVLMRHAVEGCRRWQEGMANRRLSERDWVAVLLGTALLAVLLSLGPEVQLGERELGPGLYAWLWPYLLPLHAIRGATRIGILAVFAGALLAGLGVTWLRLHMTPRRHAVVVGFLAALMLLEYAWVPLPYVTVPAVARPVDEILRADPRDVVVLEWPTNIERSDADAMFRSLAHGKRVVNGLSGFVPDLLRQLSGLLTTSGSPFPVPEAQAALREIYPLRYLVVRLDDDALSTEWRPVWRALRRETPPLLRFRGTFGSADLYEIVPVPERGVELERWVSYDFLRAHPRLKVIVRPLTRRDDVVQRVEVLLNNRLIDRIALGEEVTATVSLSLPYFRAAPNVIRLSYRYRRPAAARDDRYRVGTTEVLSPSDLRVLSVGQPHGSASAIQVNGVELSPDRRGYNLVALDPDGEVLAAAVFDTFFEPDAAGRLAAWVTSLPYGAIVAGAVRDEGSGLLTEEAVRALRTLGVAGDLRGHFREAHAFVGVKGAAPGSALEALGPQPVELTLGRVEIAPGRPTPSLGFELLDFALEPSADRRPEVGEDPVGGAGGALARRR